MDEQTLLFFIVIVKSWLNTGENIIGLKTDHIMQESSKFVDLTLDFDLGSCILLDKIDMGHDLVLEVFVFHVQFINHMLLLQNLQILPVVVQLIQVFYPVVDIGLKLF